MSQTITLSADLYSPVALKESAEAFASLAKVEVEEKDRELLVSIAEVREDLKDRLLDELLNHALEGTIIERRGSAL
jgi:hypothetical protein